MSDKLELSVLRLKLNDALRAETPEEFLNLAKLYNLSSVPDVLFMAVSVANCAIFKEVLNEYERLGKDINAQDANGQTVLHLAALQNRLDIAEILLQRPTINDTIVNNDGLTACDVATTEKMQELIARCQAKFIKKTAVTLLTAFNNNDIDTITSIFQNPRVSEVIDINGLNPDTGMTVLHSSAASDNERMVELILEHGGNPLVKDAQGRLAADLTKSKNIKRLINNAAKSQAILVESIQGQDPHGPPKMRGYLHKWTNFTSGYKLRYFVLENNKLSYMKGPEDVIKGSINMRNARVKVHSGENRKFEIKTAQNKVHLRANNPVEANQWVWSLQTSITSAKDLEKLRRSASRASRQSEAPSNLGRSANTSKVTLSQGASIDPREQTAHSLRHPSPSNTPALPNAQLDNSSENGGRTSNEFSDAGFDNDLETFEHSESDGESLEEEWDEKSAPSIESIKSQLGVIRSVIEVLMSQHPDETIKTALQASINNIDALMADLNKYEKFHFQQVQGLRGLLERSENAQRIWAKQVQSLELKNNQLEEKVFNLTLKDQDQASDDDSDDVFYDTVDEWRGEAETDTTAAGETDEATITSEAGGAEPEPKPDTRGTSHLSGQQEEVEKTILAEESFNGYEDPPRTKLKIANDNRPKLSLWSTLKNLIGKDMTKMTLPVTFNECCSLLQRSAEDMEYVDLLDKAAAAVDDPGLRMAYIAAFAASSYSSTINRIAKPFNPLLGETYEYCRPDENFRLMSEQVSHHPPVGALHAQSPKWDFYGQSNVDSCFNGRSFVINPLGLWYLNLRPDAGADVAEELYSFRKVTSSVVGILIGNPVVDNHGQMNIENHTTGVKCVFDFKARGWRASSAYHVAGTVTDKNGKELYTISGAWNDKIFATKAGEQRRLLLWQVHDRAPAPFNLTAFAITLNALPDNLRGWLFPTDTRLRPDQRAMEEGRYDEAADLKHAVEQKQRKARQDREAAGEKWEPRWFTLETHPVTGREYYKPTGTYWTSRKQHDFSKCPDIFV